MALPITPEVFRKEMEQIHELVSSLIERIDNGIPGGDLPARDIDEEIFQVRMRGELQLAASRLMALAEVLE